MEFFTRFRYRLLIDAPRHHVRFGLTRRASTRHWIQTVTSLPTGTPVVKFDPIDEFRIFRGLPKTPYCF